MPKLQEYIGLSSSKIKDNGHSFDRPPYRVEQVFTIDKIFGENITSTIALLTLIGVASSIIYNWVFFRILAKDAFWLLTPGDYTSLSVPAMMPMIIVFGSTLIVNLVFVFSARLVFSAFRKNTKRRGSGAQKLIGALWVLGWFIATAGFILYWLYGLFTSATFLESSPWIYACSIVVLSVFFAVFAFGLLGGDVPPFRVTLFVAVGLGVMAGLATRGASDAYRKLVFTSVLDISDCDVEAIQESGSVDNHCLARGLERGVFLFEDKIVSSTENPSRQIIFDMHASDVDIVFEYPSFVPVIWFDTPLFQRIRQFERLHHFMHMRACDRFTERLEENLEQQKISEEVSKKYRDSIGSRICLKA